MDMQVGVAKLSGHIVSLSLSGALNFWKLETIEEAGEAVAAPDCVFDGHRKVIVGAYYNEGRLTTVDAEGKVRKKLKL